MGWVYGVYMGIYMGIRVVWAVCMGVYGYKGVGVYMGIGGVWAGCMGCIWV